MEKFQLLFTSIYSYILGRDVGTLSFGEIRAISPNLICSTIAQDRSELHNN